jgi:hypothetical protein
MFDSVDYVPLGRLFRKLQQVDGAGRMNDIYGNIADLA